MSRLTNYISELLALVSRETLNATELGILKVAVRYLITDYYAKHDTLKQSLEELSDKLDRMIDEQNEKSPCL